MVEKINNISIKYKSLQEEYSKHKQWYETATSKANKNRDYKKMTELHKKMKEIRLENEKLRSKVQEIKEILN